MRYEQLCSLPVQGDMARQWDGCAAELWARAVQGPPPEAMKFALNASLESLPTKPTSTLGARSQVTPVPPACSTGSHFSMFRMSAPWRWIFDDTAGGRMKFSRCWCSLHKLTFQHHCRSGIGDLQLSPPH